VERSPFKGDSTFFMSWDPQKPLYLGFKRLRLPTFIQVLIMFQCLSAKPFCLTTPLTSNNPGLYPPLPISAAS
jgi:hypothetical protein